MNRLLIVQYGDYREAYQRFKIGKDETYYAQKYSVDAIYKIREKFDEVATLCCLTKEPYNEILDRGIRSIGAGPRRKIKSGYLVKLVEEYEPTHLVIRTPVKEVLSYAIRKKVKTLVAFADSFKVQGLPNKIKNYQLANLLNDRQIDWVGNHGINSCRSLEKIGVKSEKIIPWDWPHVITPSYFSPKTLPDRQGRRQIIYVGSVTEAKGVGDVLDSIGYLRSKGLSINLKVVGKGDIESFTLKARHRNLENCVEFLGVVPNKTIVHLMRDADLVLVPSRHEYPEGFPMTIYEALCSRTPIIASDHPMFRNKLVDRINALIFQAGNPVALALSIQELLSNSGLYHSISIASEDAWKNLQIPVKWGDMINRWLFDSPDNRQWLFENRLSCGKYMCK